MTAGLGKTPGAVFRYELHIGHEPKKFGSEVIYESLSYAPKGKFRRIFERHRQEFAFGPRIWHNEWRFAHSEHSPECERHQHSGAA